MLILLCENKYCCYRTNLVLPFFITAFLLHPDNQFFFFFVLYLISLALWISMDKQKDKLKFYKLQPLPSSLLPPFSTPPPLIPPFPSCTIKLHTRGHTHSRRGGRGGKICNLCLKNIAGDKLK